MSYALGLGADRPRPAGIVALSGFFPQVEGLDIDVARPLPQIAIGYGIYDPDHGVEWPARLASCSSRQERRSVPRVPYPHAVDPSSWPSSDPGSGARFRPHGLQSPRQSS